MTRTNGNHHDPESKSIHILRRKLAELQERFRIVYRSKCELEETLAQERMIYRAEMMRR